MVIYADITFVNNFLMTLAIIWAVGQLMDFKINFFMLLLSALIGSIYTFLVLLIQMWSLHPFYKGVLQIVLNLTIAIIMIKVAFNYSSIKTFLKAVGYLYLVSFISIGTTLSLFYIYGGSFFSSSKLIIAIITGLIVIYMLGKYGWNILQSHLSPEEFYLSVKIYLESQVFTFTGLLDTGNMLNDPLTNVPVVVVYLGDIIDVYPAEMQQKLTSNMVNSMEIINIFNEFNRGNRIRILPFSDLGQEHAVLVGVRPEMVEIDYKGEVIATDKVVLGMSDHIIDQDGVYQVLINPKILKI
ncbi:sigma-E processing peptidase SpoIIGA [Halocella sp. SP3-1]|uniref:sigma-E processing peptidase SpoIIGA n=1 Tax=Halocella sp. SP3-1 TaxID=2382161 RepID=UPI000F750A7C|nr:sigma-E processing peptidase SpoIIGA [Halocella sp. SP3-1]AZO95098.1 hypothetical protein D7D81_11150 [Halocella sp. SP3-1]